MKRFLPTLLLAGLLVCGASACGGPSFAAPLSRPTAAGGTDPVQSGPANAAATTAMSAGSACALTTVDEVSTAAGKPMKVLADGGPIGECIYSATSDESYVMYFEIDKSQPDIDARKQQLESSSEHIAGLGDDAFWNPTAGEVFIQQGGRALIINLPSMSNLTHQPDADKDRMITLATSAFAHL
jgi:hypothetical protein